MSTIIKDETLASVADAIREKTGKTDKMTPVEMATEIAEIPTGGEDTLAEYLSNATYEYAVPATVTQLVSKAFQNMARLSKISFNGKTKAYNDGSLFSGCSNLTEADLTNLDCSNCTTLTYWFYNCNKLAKITLPEKTGKITNLSNMFSNCSLLKELDLSALNFEKISNDGTYRFCYGCTNLDLSQNYINNSLKYLYNYCFQNCSSLDITKIGASIKEIGQNAFYACTSIKTLWVPATCTSIGANAFNASGLTDFYTPLEEAPTGWNASAFPSTVTIHYGVTEEEYDKIIGEAE